MLPFISIGPLTLPTYGLLIVSGGLLSALIVPISQKYRPIKRHDVWYCAIYALIGGLIGAKGLYILTVLKDIIANPAVLLGVMNGGAVFYGGLIGGFVGGYIYTHKYKLPFMAMADVLLPSIAFAHAMGRLGCFAAGCCYGVPSSGCLGVTYPPGGFAPSGIPLLPVQLFESGFLLLLTIGLLVLLRKSALEGIVAAAYCLIYGVWRFIIEFFRSDPRGAVGILSTSGLISLAVIAFGVFLFVRLIKKHGAA